MAQPHKGPRGQISTRPAMPVYEDIKAAAKAHGMPIGQYVADVLAAAMGYPDLVRELDKEALPLAM